MSLFLSYTVLGVVVGATFAVSASGLVVTYATTGVFNFAHGAVGMICCFSFWELAYNYNHSTMPVWLALIIVILVEAPLLGIIIERVFMRRLHGASTARSLMVTLGFTVDSPGSSRRGLERPDLSAAAVVLLHGDAPDSRRDVVGRAAHDGCDRDRCCDRPMGVLPPVADRRRDESRGRRPRTACNGRGAPDPCGPHGMDPRLDAGRGRRHPARAGHRNHRPDHSHSRGRSTASRPRWSAACVRCR